MCLKATYQSINQSQAACDVYQGTYKYNVHLQKFGYLEHTSRRQTSENNLHLYVLLRLFFSFGFKTV